MKTLSQRLPKLTFWKAVFAILMVGGLYSTIVRFGGGLGASTGLSDAFPWGLWIGFDVLCGVALAAGGFTISAVVYIFHLERFRPIVRPAILTAFLGYTLVICALMFDLGRPWSIWHAMILWNPHSVMFEVAWCVMLYSTVLALEFSPTVLERFGWSRLLRVVRVVMVPLVILGVILSMLHQSSLGSLYLIVPHKMHPLWYSPLLPVFFFVSAICLGCAMTIFESYLSYRAFRKRLELDLLADIGKVLVVGLALYLVLKVLDLAYGGKWELVFASTYESRLFLAEILLGVVAPAILLSFRKVRNDRLGLFIGATLVVLGFLFNRLNVSITAFERSAAGSYTPALTEILVTAGLVALGLFLFAMAVKYLPVFPKEDATEASGPRAPAHPLADVFERPSLNFRTAVVLTGGLVLVGSMALAFSGVLNRDFTDARALSNAKTDLGLGPSLDPTRLPNITFDFQEDTPGPAVFSHANHFDAQDPTCSGCHGRFAQIFHGAPLSEDDLADLDFHGEELCGSCHDGEKSFGVEMTTCGRCHQSKEEGEGELAETE